VYTHNKTHIITVTI